MKPSNFSQLWERLRREADVNGYDRLKSVLLNHDKKKEYICRKLGVVSDADVNRVLLKQRPKVVTKNPSK